VHLSASARSIGENLRESQKACMRESRAVLGRCRLRYGDRNSVYEPASNSLLFGFRHLRPGLGQKVVPKALFAAPFRPPAREVRPFGTLSWSSDNGGTYTIVSYNAGVDHFVGTCGNFVKEAKYLDVEATREYLQPRTFSSNHNTNPFLS
jgi:hypothetical protein